MQVFQATLIGMVGTGLTGLVIAFIVCAWEKDNHTDAPVWISAPTGIMLLVGAASVPVGTVYMVMRALN